MARKNGVGYTIATYVERTPDADPGDEYAVVSLTIGKQTWRLDRVEALRVAEEIADAANGIVRPDR